MSSDLEYCTSKFYISQRRVQDLDVGARTRSQVSRKVILARKKEFDMAPSSDFLFGLAASSSITTAGITVLVLGITYAIYTREATPLRSIPGPFLASITRLWIFQKQRGFQRQQVDMDLREKYGPIVRISPKEVMVSSPKSLRTIYGEIFFDGS